jgi:4-carboxymuconolactone decarboxylase
VNSPMAMIGAAIAAVLIEPTPLLSQPTRGGGTQSIAVRRVEPFTRVAARRIPADGGSQPPCPDSSDMCRKFSAFTSHFVTNYTIPLREKELLILRTAWLSRGQFIWGRHNNTGRKAGLTDEDISRIMDGPGAGGWSPFDAVLLRAADELHLSRFISDTTWNALAQRYSESQLLEVVMIVGNYTLLSMYQNTIGIQLEPGLKRLPE